MSANAFDLVANISIPTTALAPPAQSWSTVVVLDGDSSVAQGTIFATAAEVDAAVTATDLNAQSGAEIKAILAAGAGRGVRVILGAFDASASPTPETPTTALNALRAAGIVPGWFYQHIYLITRTDAAIDSAADWVGANAAGKALVYGSLSTSSILSGTAPATTAASDGAPKTAIMYEDVSAATSMARSVGWLAGWPILERRPSAVNLRPGITAAYATPLSEAQLIAATGRASNQARCWAHSPSAPDATSRWVQLGHTVGGTLWEIEAAVAILTMALSRAIYALLDQRAALQIPLDRDAAGRAAIDAAVTQVLEQYGAAGYLAPAGADSVIGRPALPRGYQIAVTFPPASTAVDVTGWLAFPAGVREINVNLPAVIV